MLNGTPAGGQAWGCGPAARLPPFAAYFAALAITAPLLAAAPLLWAPPITVMALMHRSR